MCMMACLAVTAVMWAGPVGEGQARAIAQKFLDGRAMRASQLELVKKSTRLNASQSAYYVFNLKRADNGFVIVAGDDRAPAVLGYSDSGTFDPNDVPVALAELLDGYAEQIAAIAQGETPWFASSRQPVQPMLSTVWAQGGPYNHLLPFTGTDRAVTGCVATAMAQVMKFWEWPVRPTTTIPAYTSSSLGIYMPALSPVNFNWGAMKDSYFSSDTLSAEGLAVAQLMLYCAQSVEMDFKKSSSGATTTYAPVAFASYFGYDPSAHSVNRRNYTAQQWEDIIYAEVSGGRPVIFSGRKSTGGHAFVCDGCDGDGLFHINWGWNGGSNGYYLLDVLNPDIQGTGSASGAYGYIDNAAAIVGIRPASGSSTGSGVEMTAAQVALNSYVGTRSSTSGNFSATVSGRFYNYTSAVFAADYGWGLFQGNTLVSELYTTYTTHSTPGRYFTHTERQLSFGAAITSGTYRIVPMYSERNANNWRPCVGWENNYIEVVINNKNCTVKGYGTAGTPDYTIDNVTFEGNRHPGRPMDIILSMTNNGDSRNDLLYMFINNDTTYTSMAVVNIEKGESGDIPFRFLPSQAGTYTVKFSFNPKGTNPITTFSLAINAMPQADLSANLQLLNVTGNNTINSNQYSMVLTITNNGTQTYREDISATIYKNTYDNYGTAVQSKNQFIELAPGATTTVRFDMDNVVDGWRYFSRAYYYSAGEQKRLASASFHTIVFPEAPAVVRGDVDGNNDVNMDDLSALINYLLTGNESLINVANAASCDNVNDTTSVSMDDLSAMINFLLTNAW